MATDAAHVDDLMASIQKRVREHVFADDEPVFTKRVRPARPPLAGVAAAGLAVCVVLAAIAFAFAGGGSDEQTLRRAAAPRPAPNYAAAATTLAARTQPGAELGRVIVPSVAYDHAVVQGADANDLARHAGHYSSSPLPGQAGTVAVAARLTPRGVPFGVLAQVRAGEVIEVHMPYAVFKYRVDSVRTVPLSETAALRGTTGSKLAVTAVRGNQRLVLAGSLAGVTPVK